MSRPRFLADQDLNDHIVHGVLRQEPTIEFLRVRDLGMSERTDEEILSYAEAERLLVVSHDVNTMTAAAFARIAHGEHFCGLLMVQQTTSIRLVIDSLVLIWTASEIEEWQNQVVFLPLAT
jgi:predicted nuclease of predicted toxin-antitoxin system